VCGWGLKILQSHRLYSIFYFPFYSLYNVHELAVELELTTVAKTPCS